MLDDYVKENSDDWIQQFSNKKWFKYSKDSYYAAKKICNLITRILIRLHSGEDIDTAINRELDLLFEIKSPIIKRTQQIIIQNLVLSEDQVLNFKEQDLLIKGRKLNWHEEGIAKSCEIKDFTLKFQFHLRRITPEEFELLTYSKGLLTDQMNISTCLEISYEFPNDRFERKTSELSFRSHLAIIRVREFVDQIVDKVIIAIKFSSGQYIFPVPSLSMPQNFYIRAFFSEGFPIHHKNWMYSFFTGKCVLTPGRFHVIQEIFNTLLKGERFPIAKQVLTIMSRADSALQYELSLTSLTMYWIIMETIFVDHPIARIAEQISRLYVSQNKNLEQKFWELVYRIRNYYMHGELWKKIEDKIKKEYQDKNIQWFVLVTREKAMRVLLYLFLLRESSDPSDELFKKRKKFRVPPTLSDKNWIKFKEWIQLRKENELGKPEKYKIRMGSRGISL